MHKQIVKYRHFWDKFEDAESALENLLSNATESKPFSKFVEDGNASREVELEEVDGVQTLIDTRSFKDFETYQAYRTTKTRTQAKLVLADNFCNGWNTNVKNNRWVNKDDDRIGGSIDGPYEQNDDKDMSEWQSAEFLTELAPESQWMEYPGTGITFIYTASDRSKLFKQRLNDIHDRLMDTPPTNGDHFNENSEDDFRGLTNQMKNLHIFLTKFFT